MPYLLDERSERGYEWLHIRGDGAREITSFVPIKCAYFDQPEYDIETGYAAQVLRLGHETCGWIKEDQ